MHTLAKVMKKNVFTGIENENLILLHSHLRHLWRRLEMLLEF